MFDKKGLYHSDLVKAGQVTATIKTPPTKSKYSGKPDWIGLVIEGKEHTLNVENEEIGAAFAEHVGQVCLINAEGSRESATVNIEPTGNAPARPAQAAAKPKPAAAAQKPAQAPAAKQPEDAVAVMLAAEKFIMRRLNLLDRCIDKTVAKAEEIMVRNGIPCDAENRKALVLEIVTEVTKTAATTIFISCDRAGIPDNYPLGHMDKLVEAMKKRALESKKAGE